MATQPLPVHGVDISHHQSGTLDLVGAKQRGLRWVYHKATEGNSFVDSNYARRRIEAKRAGLPFGAYHFARASKSDAVAEAKHFLSVAKPLPGDLRPALDLETTEGLSLTQIRAWAATFIAEVEKAIGVKPVVYTPFDLGSASRGCIIWRPRYNNSNTPPVLPYDIWQFSNGVFGVPHSVKGIGNVDLNVMKASLTVADMQIPKPVVVPKPIRLHLMEVSLQYSDTDAQKMADLDKIFARAAKRGVAAVAGTEVGKAEFRDMVKAAATKHGYRHAASVSETDTWVAVRKDLIKGGWAVECEVVVSHREGSGHHGNRGVLAVSFDSLPEIGRVTILACHYLTKGRPGAKDPDYRVNVPQNRELAAEVGRLARKHGAGSALVFYMGDQNIVDRDEDTFMGQPLTSSWDELKKWENTGHGNIDVIASYDPDGRVVAVYCRALDDSEFPLATDHWVVESGFDVRLLAQP